MSADLTEPVDELHAECEVARRTVARRYADARAAAAQWEPRPMPRRRHA